MIDGTTATGIFAGGDCDVTFTAEKTGKFAFKWAPSTNMEVTCDMRTRSPVTNNGVWRHLMGKEYDTLVALASKIRVHGSDIKITNFGNALNSGGIDYTVGLPTSENPEKYMWTDGKSHLEDIAALRRAHPTKQIEGSHIWTKPSSKRDFDFYDPAVTGANGLVSLRSCLVPQSDWVLSYQTVEDADKNSSRAIFARNFEFVNESQLFEHRIATVPYELYERAVDKLKNLQVSHTNEKHQSELSAGIDTVLKFGESIAPLLALI